MTRPDPTTASTSWTRRLVRGLGLLLVLGLGIVIGTVLIDEEPPRLRAAQPLQLSPEASDTTELVDTTSLAQPEDLPNAPVPPDSGASHLAPPVPLQPVGLQPVAAGDLLDGGGAARAASFSLKVGDLVSPYRVVGVFVMPGDSLDLEAVFSQPGEQYTLRTDAGLWRPHDPAHWTWVAPETPGVYPLDVEGPADRIRVNAFVLTPFDNEQPTLGTYPIGAYETEPLRGDPRFLPPRGLMEVNDETQDARVSPHFTLGQFTCHFPGDPKYALVDTRLLLKLEMLLTEVRERGIDAQTFTVMSAYRTPQYNRDIGNTTKYSLHLFGRAADIFIDTDGDGTMDDLNGDGQVTKADARVLYQIADEMDEKAWYQPFIGGLGLYGANSAHGPFIHVDVRGQRARW